MAHDVISNAVIGGSQEVFKHLTGAAVGVVPLLVSFEAILRELHNGHISNISSIPLSYKEIQPAKLQNLPFDPVESLEDLMEGGEWAGG